MLESHEAIDAKLMEVGNHAGATHEELRRFTDAALAGGVPEVSLSDGAMAAMIGKPQPPAPSSPPAGRSDHSGCPLPSAAHCS